MTRGIRQTGPANGEKEEKSLPQFLVRRVLSRCVPPCVAKTCVVRPVFERRCEISEVLFHPCLHPILWLRRLMFRCTGFNLHLSKGSVQCFVRVKDLAVP